MNMDIASILSSFDTNLLTVLSSVLMIGLDLLILGIGVVYLLFGFIFGTRKSIRRALSFLIPFILFLCFIDIITKIVANGDISLIVNFFTPVEGTLTIKEFAAGYLADYLYNGNVDAATASKILELAQALFITVLRTTIYIIGLFVITFGVAPFIRFITWLTFRVQIKGQPKRKLRWSSRIAGMGIASLRFIILLFVFIIPMYGTISTTHMLLQDSLTVLENIDEDKINIDGEYESIVDAVRKFEKGLNYSLFRQISNATKIDGGASFDMLILGQLSKVTTSDASVNILEEYGRYHKLIPIATKFIDPALSMQESDTVDVSEFINLVEESDIDTLESVLKDSELIDVALPVGYDYLCFYLSEEVNLEEYHLTLEDLKLVDINKDFDLIIDASGIILKVVTNENISFESTEDLVDAIITNKNIVSNLQTFITDITKTTSVKNIGLPLASKYIADAIDATQNEELIPLKDLLTPDKLELYINNDISAVFEIAKDLYETDLKLILFELLDDRDFSSINVDFSNPKIVNAVEKSITKLMTLNVVHGNENTIIKALFSLMEESEIDINEILFDESGNPRINWENETEVISSTVVALLETFGQDLFVNLENPKELIIILLESENAESIIKKVSNSDVAKALLVTIIYDEIVKSEDIPENLKAVLTAEALVKCFENDLTTIAHVAQSLYNTELKEVVNKFIRTSDFNLESIDFAKPSVKDALKETICAVLNLELIKGNQEELLEYVFNMINESGDIYIDPSAVLYNEQGQKYIDWSTETFNASIIIVDILDIISGTFGKESNTSEYIETIVGHERVINVVDNITCSKLIENLLVEVLSNYLEGAEDIPESLKSILTKEAIRQVFEKDIKVIIQELKSIYSTDLKDVINNIIDDENFELEKINFANSNIKDTVEHAFITLLNLSIIKGNEEKLLEFAIEKINDSSDLALDAKVILYDEQGNKYIDWSKETSVASSIVVDILEMLNGAFADGTPKSKYIELISTHKNTKSVIENITNSKLIENVLVEMLTKYLEDAKDIPEALKSILTKDAIRQAFESDLEVLIDEVNNIYKSELAIVLNILIDEGKFDLKQINFAKENVKTTVEHAIITLLNLSIIDGNQEALLEYAISLVNKSGKIQINAETVLYNEAGEKYIDWSKETTLTAGILVDLLEVLNDVFGKELETVEYIEIIINNSNTENVIESITNSELIKAIVIDVLNNLLSSSENLPEELKVILTKEKIEKCFEEDINDLYHILVDIYKSSLKDNILNLLTTGQMDIPDLTDESIQITFKDIVTRLLALSLISGDEETLIEMLLTNIDGLDLDVKTILYDEEGNKYIPWSNETGVLLDALFEVIEIFGTDFTNLNFEVLQTKLLNDKTKTKAFVDTISKSIVIRKIILSYLPNIINQADMIPEEMRAFFSEEKFATLDSEDTFNKEVNLLLGVVIDLLDLGITDFATFEITDENKTLLKQVLSNLLESVFIKGEEEKLFKLFVDTTNFSSILESNGIILDYSKVTDWHNELTVSIDIAMSFIEISTNDEFALGDLFKGNMTNEEIDKVVTLFDHIGKSELFKPIVYDLIGNVGYEIEITDEDKVKIEANGFGKEINSLLVVIGDAQTLLESDDLSTLSGEQVESLMTEASNGIITSKVVGTLLQTALGPDGLNINPVDINGNPKYDFTDPKVLKEQASNIGNLVDLANSVNNFDIDNTTSVTEITEAIKNLESNELAEDVVKEITGVEVNLEDMNVEEEATLIEDVYNEYTNSEDKENFVVDEELASRIESSELAGTILGILGIIK